MSLTEAKPSRLANLLHWLPGVAFTALAVWLVSRAITWKDLQAAFLAMPPASLAVAFLLYLLSMISRTLCWRTLLQRKVSLWRAFLALNEGYFLNNVLPLRLGEIGRAVLLGRRTGLGALNILPTIIVERSYDLAAAAVMLLISIPYALKMDWAQPAAIILLVLVTAGLFVLNVMARRREWVEEKIRALSARWGWVERWVLPALHSVLDGFSVLSSPRHFLASLAWMAAAWLIGLARDWFILGQLAPGAPVWWAALAIGASNLGGALPSAAASIGVFEAAAVGALALVGVSAEAGLAYALIVHIMHLVFSSLVGAIALSQEGQSLTSIFRDLRHFRAESSSS